MLVVVKVMPKKKLGMEDNLFFLRSKTFVTCVVVVLKFNTENQHMALQQKICFFKCQIKQVSPVLSLRNCAKM